MAKPFFYSNIFRYFVFVCGVFFSNFIWAGGSWNKLPTSNFKPEVKILLNPEIGLEVNAEIGNTLISKSKTLTTPIISVASKIIHNITEKNSVEAPDGIYVAWARDGERILYKAPYGIVKAPGLFGGESVYKEGNIGLVTRPGEKSANQIFLNFPSDLSVANFSNLASPVEVAHDVIVIPDKLNFKQELVYTGVSKNVITIVYREYVNDFARPAFSTELKYDLAEGDTIGYKGSRFQVLKATNIGVDYKVLKHLD